MVDLLITEERFEKAREESDEMWSDYEVFEEERDSVSLPSLVYTIVEGVITHPAGHNTVEAGEATNSYIYGDFIQTRLPDGLPAEVEKKFATELVSKVDPLVMDVYNKIEDDIDKYETRRAVQEVIESTVADVVSDKTF